MLRSPLLELYNEVSSATHRKKKIKEFLPPSPSTVSWASRQPWRQRAGELHFFFVFSSNPKRIWQADLGLGGRTEDTCLKWQQPLLITAADSMNEGSHRIPAPCRLGALGGAWPGAEHKGKIQLYCGSQQGWPGMVQTECWPPVPPYCPSWKVSTAREALSSLYAMCHFKTKYISLQAFGHLYEGQDLHTNCLWISQILSCLLISGKADVKPKGWTIQVLSEHSV